MALNKIINFIFNLLFVSSQHVYKYHIYKSKRQIKTNQIILWITSWDFFFCQSEIVAWMKSYSFFVFFILLSKLIYPFSTAIYVNILVISILEKRRDYVPLDKGEITCHWGCCTLKKGWVTRIEWIPTMEIGNIHFTKIKFLLFYVGCK